MSDHHNQRNFCRQLWEKSLPVYQAILKQPFIKELCEGSLSKQAFSQYIGQDALYLSEYGKSLSLLAAKSDQPAHMLAFSKFAEGAVLVERALHEEYFKLFDIQAPKEKSPACFAYTHFLRSTCALDSIETGMASVLPCFWIYREVGKEIVQKSTPGNPYQTWIDTYASPEFDALTEQALDITEELAAFASPKTKALMEEVFLQAAKMEYWFWHSAYEAETWPV